MNSPTATPKAVPNTPPNRKVAKKRQSVRMKISKSAWFSQQSYNAPRHDGAHSFAAVHHTLLTPPCAAIYQVNSVRRGQPTHRKFDPAVGKLAPALDLRHVSG